MNSFKVIVYSAEASLKDEIFYLNDLLASGVQQLHLRKPNTPKYVLENLLINIDAKQHSKIIIHNNYDLLDKYDLKGIHLTKKYLEKAHPLNVSTIIQASKLKGYSLSKPVHSLGELKDVEDYYDFVTLSPVFDSVSKGNHKGKLNEFEKFREFKPQNSLVYALGGITKDNICQCKEMGFDGVVALGAIWKNNEPSENYKELLNTIYQIG